MRGLRIIGIVLSIASLHPAVMASGRQNRVRHVTSKTAAEVRGPELKAFVGFIGDAEAELRYHLENSEITEEEFAVSKARLDVRRDETIRIALERGEDIVPELNILLGDELTQILPEGLEAVKGRKAGDVVADIWIYHGVVRRGQPFYVFERLLDTGEVR